MTNMCKEVCGLGRGVCDPRECRIVNHLLNLYAEEQAHTDTLIDKIVESIDAYLYGDQDVEELISYHKELKLSQSARQARDTWLNIINRDSIEAGS